MNPTIINYFFLLKQDQVYYFINENSVIILFPKLQQLPQNILILTLKSILDKSVELSKMIRMIQEFFINFLENDFYCLQFTFLFRINTIKIICLNKQSIIKIRQIKAVIMTAYQTLFNSLCQCYSFGQNQQTIRGIRIFVIFLLFESTEFILFLQSIRREIQQWSALNQCQRIRMLECYFLKKTTELWLSFFKRK
ncbi:unnamed protein product [Paramecium sonneborni]|uniref:Uncharacterized protein n=1 Tax=Paramecium sonneborni TaxID=65129 RepID=A0A8S1QKH6_9CILI|nr:unnamed protein product [Paramecium sonneborni]